MFVTPATLLILMAGLYHLTSTGVKLHLMSLLMDSFLEKQMIIYEYESKPQQFPDNQESFPTNHWRREGLRVWINKSSESGAIKVIQWVKYLFGVSFDSCCWDKIP